MPKSKVNFNTENPNSRYTYAAKALTSDIPSRIPKVATPATPAPTGRQDVMKAMLSAFKAGAPSTPTPMPEPKTRGLLDTIMAGVSDFGKFLQTPEGLKIAAALTKDPYRKYGLALQAQEKEEAQAAESLREREAKTALEKEQRGLLQSLGLKELGRLEDIEAAEKEREVEFKKEERARAFEEKKMKEKQKFEKEMQAIKNEASMKKMLAEYDRKSKLEIKKAEIAAKKEKGADRTETMLRQASSSLENINKLGEKLTDTGIVPLNAIINWSRGMLGDKNVAAFNTNAIFASKQLSSAFEGGRLSDKDYKVYRQAIPDTNDTFGQRKQKLKVITDLINKALNTNEGTYPSITPGTPIKDTDKTGFEKTASDITKSGGRLVYDPETGEIE